MTAIINATEQTLKDAIGTGELINIVYYGGSEPGAARMIAPLSVKQGKVRAKCYKTGQVKEFFLDKIAIAGDEISDYQGSRKTPDYDVIEGIATFNDLDAKFRQEFEKLGWIVISDKEHFGLYKQYKNGKIYKRPTFFIEADFINFPGRPYYCAERRYKYLSKATEALVNNAKKIKPVNFV